MITSLPPQQVEVELLKVAGELNLIVCVVVLIASLAALWRLAQCRNTVYGFVFRATVCWTLAWATWIGLWAIVWKQGPPGGYWLGLSLVLSDANTVLQLLFSLGLVLGSHFKAKVYSSFAVLTLAAIAAAHFFIGFFPEISAAEVLQKRWSLALGMFASVVIGSAFKVRYGTPWVLIVGFLYALMQPPAYETLYGELLRAQGALLILALLAALKVLFAWSVLYCLGIQPSDGKNLIRVGTEKPDAQKHDSWWPWFPHVFIAIGLFVVAADVWRLSSMGFSAPADIGGKIVGLIVSIAGFLKGLDYLWKWIRRKTDE